MNNNSSPSVGGRVSNQGTTPGESTEIYKHAKVAVAARKINNPYLVHCKKQQEDVVSEEKFEDLKAMQAMSLSGVELISNNQPMKDPIEKDMQSSFQIVEQPERHATLSSKNNEFEVLQADDYDFEMKNFIKRFGQLNFDDFSLNDDFEIDKDIMVNQ